MPRVKVTYHERGFVYVEGDSYRLDQMNSSEKKIVQYLSEARASEDALARVLQSQIELAMTPAGRTAPCSRSTSTRLKGTPRRLPSG